MIPTPHPTPPPSAATAAAAAAGLCLSGGPHLQGVADQQSSFESANVLKQIDKDCPFGTAKPYIVSGLSYNPWGRDILQQIHAVPLQTMNHLIIIRKYNLPYSGH